MRGEVLLAVNQPLRAPPPAALYPRVIAPRNGNLRCEKTTRQGGVTNVTGRWGELTWGGNSRTMRTCRVRRGSEAGDS